MARRLILDTGVLIVEERDRSEEGSVIAADDDLVIAAITVAELRTGVELASDDRRSRRSEFLSRVLQTIPVQPYDLATAEVHGRLLAHVHRIGSKRGAHDLIIAATAAATRRTLVTTDRTARLDALPGVEHLVIR